MYQQPLNTSVIQVWLYSSINPKRYFLTDPRVTQSLKLWKGSLSAHLQRRWILNLLKRFEIILAFNLNRSGQPMYVA